ncbi:MAG: ABC transporter permease [Lachnospiraceae bacterium]|nr:ABC transporter permease [Lachnospiraceae bacterium]MCM1240157.1 ABC transporter permease [Lachnospiraceae bacterium]
MKVTNKKVIRRISFAAMKAGRLKNLVSVMAIALTTVLFTALFTILLSVNDGYEAQNFRQVGTYSHGALKYLTEEQVQEFAGDRAVREYGLRRYVGMANEAPFHKYQVEISYCDANSAKWMFLEPVEGALPEEGTREAATDTMVLSLLGVEPVIGAEFTLPFEVDGTEVTETFVLSGYWEYDSVSMADHVLIPLSRAEEIFEEYDITPTDGMTGAWNMDVMLNNSFRIPDKMLALLERHGYQGEDSNAENYMPIGVNWGYTSYELLESMDFSFVLAMLAMLALIVFTGYLIIYNVFRISVANDIRFYGMLKTIGTTGRQLKRMVRQQALCLSAAGIPLGLLLGWLVGCGLTGIVIEQLDGVQDLVSANILIFIGSALFSLFTVFVSCRKPGKMAASVSPVEAVRYTERDSFGKRKKSGSTGKGASLPRMAWANLGRSRGKTALTVISLSLSLVLLNITVTLSKGFDMDKYLRKMNADFLVADASYFRCRWDYNMGVSEELIEELKEQGGIADSGRTYGINFPYGNTSNGLAYQYITEEVFRRKYNSWSEETMEYAVAYANKEQGLLQDNVQIYGMEPFILDHLEVLEGDISRLYGEGNYVAVCDMEIDVASYNQLRPGDKVLICYAEGIEYYNPVTGEVYPDYESIRDDQPYRTRPVGGRLVEYEVAAIVELPSQFNYRYFAASEYIMNADTFKEHSGMDSVMYYAFDVEKPENGISADEESGGSSESRMESFLADYTENEGSQYDYESKAVFAAAFESMRSMYAVCGGVLSFIVGLVGVLNFVNVIVTSVLSRKRELAVLQSVGMTGKQLKNMLIMEGLYYGLGAVAVAFLLTLVSAPLAARVMSGMFWFFSYHFTVMPIMAVMPVFGLLGVVIPLWAHRYMAKKSVVERLREAE